MKATRLPTIDELTVLLSGKSGKIGYTTTVKAGPGYDNFLSALAEIERGMSSLTVGVHEDEGLHHEASSWRDTTVAEVALWNEFGTDNNIPPRSFMRSTMDKNAFRYQRILNLQAIKIYEGKQTVKGSLLHIGKIIAADMRKAVRDMAFPPNKPSTIAAKGFNDPLIETEQLAKAIKHKLSGDDHGD